MIRRLPVLPLSLALLTLVGCGRLAPAGVSTTGEMGARAAAGEVVVRFKPAASRQVLLQNLGMKAVRRIAGLDALVVKGGDATALARLQADPGVLYAAPNRVVNRLPVEPAMPQLAFETGDDMLELLWGMKRIQAPAAWKISTGSRNIKVAVVDTGVDYTHPDFGGRVLKGRDFINNDDDAMDDHYHGTHCAGTVGAGIDNEGVVGVCPEATILAVKVLDAKGNGSDEQVASGIVYAADQGVDVINLSVGGPHAQVIDDAVAYAVGKGVVVAAAMGNEGSEVPSCPADAPGAMAVGAITPDNIQASFSNMGKHISVCAPGYYVLSTLPNGRYGRRAGTSMACPHVAGLAALVKSVHPDWDNKTIKNRLEQTADEMGPPGFDKFYGWGCINAAKALTL